MAKFKLPVTWEVCGEITIEAESLEDAVKEFEKNSDCYELPENPEYVNGSFDLSCREIEYLEVFQKKGG